jgi:superfamily II DNA/RNA helicase
MSNAFASLGLSHLSVSALLGGAKQITIPTEIQRRALPILLKGASAILLSETGSGKTLAYALPLCERLVSFEQRTKTRAVPRHPRALILSPTRELTLQISHQVKALSHHLKFASTPLANTSKKQTAEHLSRPLDVIIASPSLVSALVHTQQVFLDAVQTLVIDEADTMLSATSGFAADVAQLARQIPPESQIVLAGATLNQNECQRFLSKLRPFPAIIQSSQYGRPPANMQISVRKPLDTEGFDKHPVLLRTVQEALRSSRRVLVFCNSVPSCRSTAHMLDESLPAAAADAAANAAADAAADAAANAAPSAVKVLCLHGDMLPKQRMDSFKAFSAHTGAGAVAVCTDVAARGLDFTDVEHVVMFDLPRTFLDFLHRSGRTARAGRAGRVTVLVGKGEAEEAKALLAKAHALQ